MSDWYTKHTKKDLAERIEQLEAQLKDWQASQQYRYIGIDGKPVLARDLEDRAIKAETELAAERALADILREDLSDYVKLDESHGLYAYRKARGL